MYRGGSGKSGIHSTHLPTATISTDVLSSNAAGVATLQIGPYLFRPAATEDELDQLHRLNYRTFIREIPQHDDNGTGVLVDKFHDKNIYIVGLLGRRVIGMIALHDQPPFSAAGKLADPAVLDNLAGPLLEVRLLAIEPGQRHRMVFAGLGWLTYQYGEAGGYSHLLISGVDGQLDMYRRLGFAPLGPAVESGRARFVPMAMSIEHPPTQFLRAIARYRSRIDRLGFQTTGRRVSFLPGPVQLAPQVAEAANRPAISHRGEQFVHLYQRVRAELSSLVGDVACALFCGSGTLANDVVAASLSADPTIRRGLILVNGEFGQRLVNQAKRFGLSFDVLDWPWGRPWALTQVADTLDQTDQINWIWAAHLETSTGMINDLPPLIKLANQRHVRVCLDCVSSVGAAPTDLSGVYLASGTSGKSLGAVAGLAIVFCSPEALDNINSDRLPNYLDVASAMKVSGPRFTMASSGLLALAGALEDYQTPKRRSVRFAHYAAMGRVVRRELLELGLTPLVDGTLAAPVITTFTPPPGVKADQLLEHCRQGGYELAGDSQYLRDRGWVQIATMGNVTLDDCRNLFDHLSHSLSSRIAPSR